MSIGKGWLFIIGIIIALAVLAPDSNIGSEIRNVFSQLRGTGSILLDTAGEGARETGDFIQ